MVTGVSGSGKSTLAFDILFAEGQRRYLESLNAYARQFVQAASRPDVDAIFGIPPTVAIEQRTSRGGRKSTVGTLTEVHHFLRLLFVKLGTQHCPDCDVPIEPQSEEVIAARLLKQYRGQRIALLAPLDREPQGRLHRSREVGAVARATRTCASTASCSPARPFPRIDRFKEHTIELPVGDVVDLREGGDPACAAAGQSARDRQRRGARPGGQGSRRSFSTKRACRSCGRSFPELDPRLFSYNSKHGWCAACYGTGLQLDGRGVETTSARAPAPRTTCSTRGSSGWRSTSPAPTATASG